MHTKHQRSVCGTGDKDGLILGTTGFVSGAKYLAFHNKAPGENLGLNF